MEIIDILNLSSSYKVSITGDALGTIVFTNPYAKDVGDIVIQQPDKTTGLYMAKVIFGPKLEQSHSQNITAAFLQCISDEMQINSKMFDSIKDIPLKLYIDPVCFVMTSDLTVTQLKAMLTLLLSALRVMNNHTDIKPLSGVLH